MFAGSNQKMDVGQGFRNSLVRMRGKNVGKQAYTENKDQKSFEYQVFKICENLERNEIFLGTRYQSQSHFSALFIQDTEMDVS